MAEAFLWTKADPELRKALRRPPTTPLHVIFVLDIPPVVAEEAFGGPADRAATWAERFRERSDDFERALERLGGRVVERFWINSSISALATRDVLEVIAERVDVRQIILVVERNIMLS
jgi:hypothetical protein